MNGKDEREGSDPILYEKGVDLDRFSLDCQAYTNYKWVPVDQAFLTLNALFIILQWILNF